MRKTLFLIRGLPGSGKSSLGKELADTYLDYNPVTGGYKSHSYEADDWFVDEHGEYKFDIAKLREAHNHCKLQVSHAMAQGIEKIAVCHTFTQAWEAAIYFRLAESAGYHVFVIECQNEFGNVHGCPPEKIAEMKDRWEPIREVQK